MDKITMCYSCKGMNLKEDSYEDWDDSEGEGFEVIREGHLCLDCLTFHYEENDRIYCVTNYIGNENKFDLKGYIPEI